MYCVGNLWSRRLFEEVQFADDGPIAPVGGVRLAFFVSRDDDGAVRRSWNRFRLVFPVGIAFVE